VARIDALQLLRDASEIVFLPAALDFIDTYNFPRDLVEAAVRYPDELGMDPHAEDVDYPVLRVRRGDLILSVGLLDLSSPCVMYIHLYSEDIDRMRKNTHKKAGVAGKASDAPKTPSEEQSWFTSRGCIITKSANGLKVTYHGRYVGTIHLTGHQGGKSFRSAFEMNLNSLYRIKEELAAIVLEKLRTTEPKYGKDYKSTTKG
jgi:hypothetical protein